MLRHDFTRCRFLGVFDNARASLQLKITIAPVPFTRKEPDVKQWKRQRLSRYCMIVSRFRSPLLPRVCLVMMKTSPARTKYGGIRFEVVDLVVKDGRDVGVRATSFEARLSPTDADADAEISGRSIAKSQALQCRP
jgi:hypothetical protein